jgi:ribosomal protein L29
MLRALHGAVEMPDTPVAPHDGGPYDPLMEARVSRLEEEMREVKAVLPRMEAAIIRIETTLAATLPHLATKADIADLRTEMKADYADLRTEMKSDYADLRTELKGDHVSLRTEIKADYVDLRTEVKSDHASLKSELKSDIARLDADKPGKAYMWGILAVLLTAYACGLAALAVLK